MTATLADLAMRLAICSLGQRRRQWALAMQAEFDAAAVDGQPFAFAAGCLIAAWTEMPRHEQGRFVLANYALALGLLIPMAALQLGWAVGLSYSPFGLGGLHGVLGLGAAQQPYLADAYPSALPDLLGLWVLLGVAHLRLAWLLLERDWSRILGIGALAVAASATLAIFSSVLFLDDAGVGLQALLLAIELSAIYASARWHARLFPAAWLAGVAL